MKKHIFSLALLLAAIVAHGQDLVYKPKNPAFGGDTFNYNWLLSSAQAQNTLKDPSLKTTTTSSSTASLTDFTTTLNRLLLSQISQQLINSQFGENGLKPGSYTIGNFNINVGATSEGTVIDINDLTTGQQTQVIIPFF